MGRKKSATSDMDVLGKQSAPLARRLNELITDASALRDYLGVSTGVYITSPKNGKSRTVDVGPDVLKLLQRLRVEQAGKAISRYVFTQEHSPDVMNPQSPTRYFKKFGQRYGIEDFHPHKLRHTSASIAITNGADVVSVSERLGHSDTAVTLRMYAHANEESIRRAGQVVRDALKAQGE